MIGSALAIAIAVVGLVRGSTPAVDVWQPPPPPAAHPAEVLPAPTYLAMDGRARGPNRAYRSDLATLVEREPPADAAPGDASARAAALARRAGRRAYDGAPPVIPHPVDAARVGACLSCHGEGRAIDGLLAPRIPHPPYVNCTQCHAPPAALPSGDGLVVASTFAGLATWGRGGRAQPTAPPTIPHPTAMRGDCMSCHGTRGAAPLRTPHPERVNCQQCHAPGAALDQHRFPVP